MGNEQGTGLYKAVKWLWLLLQALILPLAVLHAISSPVRWPLAVTPRIDGALPTLLLYFVAAVFLVLWLIAQSLLAMARFPLTLKGGSLLVGGTVAQFVSQVASGGSLAEAVYGVFFATLVALAAIAAIWVAIAIGKRLGPPLARLAALLALLPAAGLLWVLLAPLRQAYSRLAPGQQVLAWLVLAANSVLIVFSLYHLSIFAASAETDATYAREWEGWAAPTIIILILSAAAALVLAASSRM